MVAAEKAHKLAQHGSKPSSHEVDANLLLQLFEEKLDSGAADEALRLASTAVDLFYKQGNKAGESRALSCVAQAMASGGSMSSKVAGAPLEATAETFLLQDSSGAGFHGSKGFDESELDVDIVEDNASSTFTDFTDLPISYGERLILETCMRSKGRPYDRQRQEVLARPRRRGASAEAWGITKASFSGHSADLMSSSAHGGYSASSGAGFSAMTSGSLDPMNSTTQSRLTQGRTEAEPKLSLVREAALVSRLCQPKRRKAAAVKPPGEQLLLKSQERAAKLKAGGSLDISSIVARLSAPRAVRALSPTPGERVVLMWNRSEDMRKPDLNRINELAKSSRRGGTARAWGVYEAPGSARSWNPDAWMVPASASSSRAPESAREKLPGVAAKDLAASGDSHDLTECLSAALPPLDATWPDSPPVTPAQNTTGAVPESSQDTGHTWHHPWKRSGVDRHA